MTFTFWTVLVEGDGGNEQTQASIIILSTVWSTELFGRIVIPQQKTIDPTNLASPVTVNSSILSYGVLQEDNQHPPDGLW